MNERQFWQRATDLLNYYRSRFDHCILIDEEQNTDISNFLDDMDVLAAEWYNRATLTTAKRQEEARMEIEAAMTTELREFHSGYCLTDKDWDVVKAQICKLGRVVK